MEDKRNRGLVLVGTMLIAVLLLCGAYIAYFSFFNNTLTKKSEKKKQVVVVEDDSFNMKIIKEVNKGEKNNYLISPYSIEIALNMLRDGTNGNSKKELDNLLGKRKINYIQAEKRINVANGVFIKDSYKEAVLDDYNKTINKNYNGEIVYDKLETPKVVNEWVNKQTNGMIPKLTDETDPNLIMMLVNALAIDVDWLSNFECNYTSSEEFTKIDGSKYDVSMMKQAFDEDAKYFKTDDSKGVILPYKKYGDSELEFIGILPNKDAYDYVNKLTSEKINDLYDKSKEVKVVLSLPRFSYDYEMKDSVKKFQKLGVKDVFDESKADLSKMVNAEAFVGNVIHKTHISLNEKGTKAAAVTAVEIVAKSAPPSGEQPKEISFNKPFVYMIRDKKTKEMLFFGVVYEPEKWNGSTCQK